MSAIAFLAVVFGFMAQMILDGQTFTHAIFGIVSGIMAILCGMSLGRRDRRHRWEGWLWSGLGAALVVWCVALLPSAYQTQEHFNHRRDQRQQMREENKTANKSLQATRDGAFSSASRFTLVGPACLSSGR